MFVVRHTYPLKAVNYIRMHGDATHSQGAQGHDVINRIRDFGIVPESEYPGLKINEPLHNHGEMEAALHGMLTGVLARKGKRLTPRWLDAYQAVLDVYLGEIPESFVFQGNTYTPLAFAKDYLQINGHDYIEITSFSHQPFYEPFRLEIPDNWDYNSNYYNVPLDELEQIADYALNNGYSFCWDADVSERDFNQGSDKNDYGTGIAIVPLPDYEYLTKAEKKKKMTAIVKEKEIDQEYRQHMFNNFATTDDHLMHAVGLAKDQQGNKFYYIKNSWGTDSVYKGYNYISRSYFRLKTIVVIINTQALPPQIRQKLSL
jgi:bleomycin hydrolase